MTANGSVKPMRIAIIGGGIVGLSLAIPLANAQKSGAPIEVHVYEAASAFGEIGAAVGMAPNAQRVLRRMGMGSCLDKQMDPGAIDPKLRDKLFDVRNAAPGLTREESFIFEACYIFKGKNTGLGLVHRADFLEAQVALFPPDQVSFHKRLDYYVDKPGSPIQLKFVDGTTAEAEGRPISLPLPHSFLMCFLVLIGCDGIKSVTRRCMFSDDTTSKEPEGMATRAKYSGWMTYRALVPVEAAREVVSDTFLSPTMWLGYDKHLFALPLRQGTLLTVVSTVRDRTGERAIGKNGPWQDIVDKSLMQHDFEDFNDEVKTLLKSINDPISWGIFDLPELPWFNNGRVAIAGDAAHASTPFQGAGAGSGIEDAFILQNLLTHPDVLSSPAENIPKALEAYSHVRRPRATMVQRTSALQGMLFEFHLPGVMDDTQKMVQIMDGRMDWIWNWDEDQAVQEALDFFLASVKIGRKS